MQTFRIVLHPEPEGGYTVTVPSLSGCITWGKDVQEARAMAKEAIELYTQALRASGESIPDDSQSLELSLTVA